MKLKNVKIGVEVVVKKSADLDSFGIHYRDDLLGKKGLIVEISTDEVVRVDFGDALYYMRLDMLKLANKG